MTVGSLASKTRDARGKWIRLTSEATKGTTADTEEHDRRDVDTWAGMKGKFLLSDYPSERLTQHTEQN